MTTDRPTPDPTRAALSALLSRASVTVSTGVNQPRESTLAVYVNEGVWNDFVNAARAALAQPTPPAPEPSAALVEARDALLRLHERGDYTEEGWAPSDDGHECRACGAWCDTPAKVDNLIALARAEVGVSVEAVRLLAGKVDAAVVHMEHEHYGWAGTALREVCNYLAALATPPALVTEAEVLVWREALDSCLMSAAEWGIMGFEDWSRKLDAYTDAVRALARAEAGVSVSVEALLDAWEAQEHPSIDAAIQTALAARSAKENDHD